MLHDGGSEMNCEVGEFGQAGASLCQDSDCFMTMLLFCVECTRESSIEQDAGRS